MQNPGMLDLRQRLPKLIQTSWRRCSHAGMNPQGHVHQTPLNQAELLLQQEQSRQLRKMALREMNILEHTLVNAGRILLLTDANGMILDSHGDQQFLGRARVVSLMPGACWQEQRTGTNAIGTAIIEHRFIQVIGTQHFFEENRFLACNAMPIMSPTGCLAGVLDISGNATESFATAGRLVRHAVAHIEHGWATESATDLVVRLHQHPSWLGTPEEGVLLFHDDLLTGASSRGLSLAGLTPQAIGLARWLDIFERRPAFGLQELSLQHLPEVCYANLSRVHSVPTGFTAAESGCAEPTTFNDLKDDLLRRAITAEDGNVSAAARKLGVHRSTFYRRLKKERDGQP